LHTAQNTPWGARPVASTARGALVTGDRTVVPSHGNHLEARSDEH
jgi:hypothetical protein